MERIFAVSALAFEDASRFMQLLIQQKKETSEKELRQKKRTLSQMQKRIADLDKIFSVSTRMRLPKPSAMSDL